jgi:hypothetical protein
MSEEIKGGDFEVLTPNTVHDRPFNASTNTVGSAKGRAIPPPLRAPTKAFAPRDPGPDSVVWQICADSSMPPLSAITYSL